jgi:phage tail-like protein
MANDSLNVDKWPVAKFYFLVSIKGGDYEGDISFQEVSGLDQETDVIEYRHGDSPNFGTIKKPGLIKNTNVVCRKGIFPKDGRLVDMFNNLKANKIDRMTVTIKLQDENGNPMMIWELAKAFPVKLQGTDLKSDSSEVAIETIEFAHEGLSVKVS